MLLRLDFSAPTPIYQQIRNQIAAGIVSGELSPGERLPTIRALADELGVNMMTVNKAYALLKREGYIAAAGRGGSMVAQGPERASFPPGALEKLGLLAAEVRRAGVSEEGFLEICRRCYREGGSGHGHV